VASLFVIQGADQGKRFELPSSPLALGRQEGSNSARLNDTEVSRRHAEVRPVDEGYRIVDLGSSNGTFVNGQPVQEAMLQTGDRLQLGQTVLLFNAGGPTGSSSRDGDLTTRVDLLSRSSPDDRSAILKSIPSGEGSRVLQAPEAAAGWLRERLLNLSVMYRATQAISHVPDIDSLLPQILELVFESIGADRGAILMTDSSSQLVPKAVRWRVEARADERIPISRSIIEYVLGKGEGVITSDAPSDTRFSPGESIVDNGIREAICVPIQGRHLNLGVIYADVQADSGFEVVSSGKPAPRGRFSRDQLMLMVAIGHQAGLAIENTQFYNDKIQAERLAAVGQTIATISHHIKNILQGMKGGSYLVEMGLQQKDEAIIRQGWTAVDKNQTRIYNLVMDMLSFSKDREPGLERADLNETVGDVVELMQSRAQELGVGLAWTPSKQMPPVRIDPEGIHRAVLNIVTNAIDASEGAVHATVSIATSWDEEKSTATIRIQDNGMGIEESKVPMIFQIFSSSKGSKGTGLGLPVSQKIIREHGGKIRVESEVGRGAAFIIELPMTTRGPEESWRPETHGTREMEQVE
jgi:signal transduction histidine kinase/pSer/pThr/pTyr-binding forkhead associated (FHA) protein